MRTQSIFRLALSLLLIALLSQAFTRASAQSRPSVPDLDIILVTDESSSIWQENDSDGWRIVMDDLFVDMLGVDQSGASHQLSAVMFGSEATLVQPLGPVNERSLQDTLKQAITRKHEDMGGTNFTAALRTAYQELDEHGRPGSNKAIVFLTDGRCELQGQGEAGTAQCNQQVRELVSRNAGKVRIYSIAFTEAAFQQDPNFGIYKSLLQEISATSGGKYFESQKSEEGLLKVYMGIIQDLMGLVPSSLPPAVNAPIIVPFDIPDGLYQIVFTAVKYEVGIDTAVIDPNNQEIDRAGTNVRFATSGRTDVYSITNPQPGRWNVRLEGRGAVTVMSVPFPKTNYKINLLAPGNTFPAGKPMNLLVQVVDNNGKAFTVDGLKASVSLDDQPVEELPFSARSDGTYQASLANTQNPGNYKFTFTSQPQASNLPRVDDEKTVIVVKAPWIKIVEPQADQQYPVNQPLNVRVQMMFGTSAVEKPEESENLKVNASIVDDQMQSQGNGPMKVGADGFFMLPFTFTQPFTGLLSVQMAYLKSTGEYFIDTDEVSFIIGGPAAAPATFTPEPAAPVATNPPPPTPTRLPSPTPITAPPVKIPPGAIAGGLGGLLLLAGAAGVGFWYWSKPSLVGMLNVGSSLVPLAGKKPVIIGSDPQSTIPLSPEDGILPRHALLRPVGGRKNPQVELVSLDINNPVKVNGFLTPSQILQNGDKIEIGNNEIDYTGPATFDGMDFNQTQTNDFDQTNPAI